VQKEFTVRDRNLLLISLLTVLGALSAYAQSGTIRANIPFAFSAGGKQLPAGQYAITRATNGQSINVVSDDRKNSAAILIMTRTAGAIHTTAGDSHVVFDKVGETYTLSELWYPGTDGYVLNSTKEQHEHRVVDVSVK
jgi:hypothetical protein